MRDLLDEESISRKEWFYKFDEIIIDHKLPVWHALKNLILNDVQDNIFWYAKCILHFRLGVFKLTKFIQYIWSFGSKYSIKLIFFLLSVYSW